MGTKGLVWSASAMGVLLDEGVGDTIRVSLTPRPGGDPPRKDATPPAESLPALRPARVRAKRHGVSDVGRATSTTFQELAEAVRGYIRDGRAQWKKKYEGVETLTLAVMGCVVDGPGGEGGQHRHLAAGNGGGAELPVFIDGVHATTLKGTYDELAHAFHVLLDEYVAIRVCIC